MANVRLAWVPCRASPTTSRGASRRARQNTTSKTLTTQSYTPEIIPYGVSRYQNETRRLYGVLERHLKETKQEYLVGNKCTIADIAHWGWIAAAGWSGIDIDEFPTLKAWEERMLQRPGVEKGRHVPDPHTIKEVLKDKAQLEKRAAEARAWIQEGMKRDAQK